jgi:hypothetical protein
MGPILQGHLDHNRVWEIGFIAVARRSIHGRLASALHPTAPVTPITCDPTHRYNRGALATWGQGEDLENHSFPR